MNNKFLEETLKELPIASYRFFESTDSTNTQALNWLLEGAPEYALVMADNQTAGRGRNLRKWVTTPGSSIAVSIILHPTNPEIMKLGLFSLLAGFSVYQVFKESFNIDARIKWPNDVLIDKKKAAGILAESSWEGKELRGIVVGIGINLLMPSIPPADGLLFPATCVQAHHNGLIQAEKTLASIIQTFINLRKTMLSNTFIRQYEEKLAYRNETIALDMGNGRIISGQLLGVDAYGNARIQNLDGNEQIYPIGDIKLRPI